MPKGTFLVIDGSDGTGKKTQYQLLIERFETEKIPYAVFDFPRYGQPSAYFVENYLAGRYGGLDEVNARAASLFYALDRYDAAPQIKHALEEGKVVLANRFSVSNMGHQGAKLTDKAERRNLYHWIDMTEHDLLAIPRPDLNLILSIPHTLAQANIDHRASVNKSHKDIHESDLDFMRRSIDVYNELCEIFPDHCRRIECARNDQEMKKPEEIHEQIWQIFSDYR